MLSCIAEMIESSPSKSEEGASTVYESPITGIVRGLMKSTLSPRNHLNCDGTETEENRLTHNGIQLECYLNYCELFKDAFKFKSTPENTVKSKPKVRRLLGMASRRFSSTESVSPSVEKENSNTGCSPRGISPQKIVGGKKSRYPLEDCDPNSQDSGYEASYPEKEEKPREAFRFVEPMAVAPRRTSIESRSPMESPVRSSPRRMRARRPTLFRSLSSGYESMDDGFNDLIDVEPLEDTTRLPNGISTLLCGDIVGTGTFSDVTTAINIDSNFSPSTPEFPRTNRTGNFRRSLSLQNERSETRKNSSLSKVRSCLFRSPNANSSTVNPGFEDDPLLAMTVPVSHRRRVGYGYDHENDFGSPLSVRTFKRPDPPIDDSPKLVKKSRRSSTSFLDAIRHCNGIDVSTSSSRFAGIPFQRSLSETSATITAMAMAIETTCADTRQETQAETETHALIKSAIHRSSTDMDLTGDFSKSCVLPLATGHHEDLKSISVDTLAALIRGEFHDRIGSFKIVDCRYPYEFDAGHIQGALNLYSKDLIERILLDPLTNTPEIQPDTNKRNILVFHCEFSWERGPNLSRFLRNLDRQRNKEHYPALYYPEVYLLHGGYEQFYKEQKGLCSPQGYRPMRHPDHEADLKQFRSKSKSWQGEKSRICAGATRTNLKRLGF
ncbi:M-phase inducer phosphatase [Dufourea novaeangliae]|uniref:protein-tyrosine-phosphatase n=1 Tax=Dufourea novaeangliae TaxID=178035 RepID=A0A154P246_DUFNO|nr:M-phase inducer phosphatase [Dufourea novaeangliae]